MILYWICVVLLVVVFIAVGPRIPKPPGRRDPMKRLLCPECEEKTWRTVIPAAGFIKRTVYGKAKEPTREQRTIRETPVVGAANGELMLDRSQTQTTVLEAGHYNCDDCNKPIYPGDRAACMGYFMTGRQENWEAEYLTDRENIKMVARGSRA